MNWLQSLSWRTHALLTGRRIAWCAWAYQNQHIRFWVVWCWVFDGLLGKGHCAESAEWWKNKEKNDETD